MFKDKGSVRVPPGYTLPQAFLWQSGASLCKLGCVCFVRRNHLMPSVSMTSEAPHIVLSQPYRQAVLITNLRFRDGFFIFKKPQQLQNGVHAAHINFDGNMQFRHACRVPGTFAVCLSVGRPGLDVCYRCKAVRSAFLHHMCVKAAFQLLLPVDIHCGSMQDASVYLAARAMVRYIISFPAHT